MRKILLALFAMVLVVAFTAPSYAADFKYSGFFRIRGIAGNNGDRDEDNDDSISGFDALTRPRFTAKTDKGKIWALWEIDWFEESGNSNANTVFGRDRGRVGVGTNRWVVDFAVPGSKFRARWGRTDFTSPDKQIFDSAGASRWPGMAVYGKLSKNISLSMFMARRGTSGSGLRMGAEDANDDRYYGSVGIKVSPAVTLTPWLALARDGQGKSLTYAALHAKGKVGIVGLNLSGVSVSGDADEDTDASGWALLASGKASLGKLTLIGTAILLSGDDEADDGEEGKFANLMPGGGQFISGVMVTDRSTTGGITSFRARLQGGAGPTRATRFQNLNGAVVLGGDAVYKVTKTFKIFGGVHIYQSAEEAPGADMVDDTNFGTEFNTGFHWNVYPKLQLRTQFAYLSAGDYGKAMSDDDFDDSWTAMFSLRHGF